MLQFIIYIVVSSRWQCARSIEGTTKVFRLVVIVLSTAAQVISLVPYIGRNWSSMHIVDVLAYSNACSEK